MKDMFEGKSQTQIPHKRKEKLKEEEGNNDPHTSSSSISLSSFPILIFPSKFLHRNTNPTTTENPPSPPICKFPVISISISLFFCLTSFILCLVAEFLRNKQDDLRWNGRLCHAPLSPSYGLGIAALACLVSSQLLANFIFFNHPSAEGRAANPQFTIPVIAKVLVLISWLCCVVAMVILTVAVSMSAEQSYGEGWLNGECYLVKRGTFVGSAILIFVSIASITASSFSTIKVHPK